MKSCCIAVGGIALSALLGLPTSASTAQRAEEFFASGEHYDSRQFSCLDDEEVWIAGRFVTDAPTIILARTDSDGCYLQHVRGPKAHLGAETWFIRSMAARGRSPAAIRPVQAAWR